MALVFLGAANVGFLGANSRVKTVAELTAFLAPYAAFSQGVKVIDTARAYVPAGGEGSSEALLGAHGLEGFAIDSKATSFVPKAHQAAKIIQSGKEILEAVKRDKINVLYLHAPDRKTPFEETCGAINQLYKQGSFAEFGLSNYTAEEVESIVQICKKHDYVPPTVYQGQYNALCRAAEGGLMPTLRRHSIRFVGWSPLAGGALTGKLSATATAEKGSRFDVTDPNNFIAHMYQDLYAKPSVFAALENLKTLATNASLTPANVALRWTRYHSFLTETDALIIGASSPEQLQRNLDDLEGGRLSDDLVKGVESIWDAIPEVDRPSYHF